MGPAPRVTLPMHSAVSVADSGAPARRWARLLLLLTGLVIPQVVLFGPSLVGNLYLLPLDLLTGTNHYLQPHRGDERVLHSLCYGDIVTHNEPDRQFAAAELRAGRLPLWNPYVYGGTPFAVWPRFAPHSLLYCLFPTPVTLAWLQLAKSVLAGVGAYVFFRRVLAVGFWPAVVGAWVLPLTAYYILWQGCLMSYATTALPWLLLGVEAVVRRPGGWGGPLLAATTGLLIISSSSDLSALVLLATGIYALGRLVAVHAGQWRQGFRAGTALTAAWALGILIALPHVLPLLQYAGSSARLEQRLAGYEPRPPLPLSIALAQVVVPRAYGPLQHGYIQFFEGNFLESAAGTYIGLVATLWLAPLGLLSRAQRARNALWLVWVVLGLGWQLDLPVVSQAMRLPLINVLPYGRFVFATSFALVALAVVGLDLLGSGVSWRPWCWLFPALLAALGFWCVKGCLGWPEYLDRTIELALLAGTPVAGIPNVETLWNARYEYLQYRLLSALFCGAGLLGWLGTYRGMTLPAWRSLPVAALWVGELLYFGYGRTPQCDPALYYPSLPIFEELRRLEPGRIVGVMCFPPNYCVMQRLRDVRGYDGVDPARWIQVLELARRGPTKGPENRHQLVQVQWYIPDLARTEGGEFRTAPVLSMLNVRYFLFFGPPIPGWPVKLQGDGFWVYENPDAVPRVFVPRQVRWLERDEQILAAFEAADFVPLRTAYLEGPASCAEQGPGKAQIVAEVPTELTIDVHMETAGFLVVADRWDPDWHAYIDGQQVPLHRADYVLRAAEVPAGHSTVVFRYEPAALYRGLVGMVIGLAGTLLWTVRLWVLQRRGLATDARRLMVEGDFGFG